MCPRRLIDAVSDTNVSDDDFDRHGRIRRRPWYSDSEDGHDSGSSQLLDSPAETNDNTEQLADDPGHTSLANPSYSFVGGKTVLTLALLVYLLITLLPGSSTGTTRIFLYFNRNYAPALPNGEGLYGFMSYHMIPIISVLRSCLRLAADEGPFLIESTTEYQTLIDIADHVLSIERLARYFS
ncbi:hypothetical protein GGR55DRAFT_696575 [Xylaria sp. FL0064]|nr:hypothetical protein GGR55DRAFT_696575 [Xylaria sp. FL0064]